MIMKFTCTVEINASREKVVELFNSSENLKEWQDGFQRLTHVSGEAGMVGAKSTMYYKYGKREMELEETILVSDLPREFTGQYVHKHMTNTMQNLFEEIEEGKTRWTANLDYIKITGFMPKIIFKLFPRMARKQTQKWLDQFKAFVERS